MVKYQKGTILEDKTGQGHYFLVAEYESHIEEKTGANTVYADYELIVLHDNGSMATVSRAAGVIESWLTGELMEEIPTYEAPQRLQQIAEEVQ